MSVDRAQIEHLRSFVATPRCMSYETIRSLDDILDNLEAASSEVAALRRQLEERKSPDMVTVPREEWEALRELEHQAWSALDEVENHGECDMTGISGAYKAAKESLALRSGEAPAQRGEEAK